MPIPKKVENRKNVFETIENKIIGMLKPAADPYQDFPRPERIKNAVYELPQGLTEKEAMIFTLGAIFSKDILRTMETSSSAGGKNWESFAADYVIENVFAREESVGRLKNLPEKIGEGRERAVLLFQEYAEGNKGVVKHFGQNAILAIYDGILNITLEEGSASAAAFGIVAKMAYEIMEKPEFGLGNVLNKQQKQQFRAFVRHYEMDRMAAEAEVELHEHLPEKNSTEREEQLKKAWLMNALVRKYGKETSAKSNAAMLFVRKALEDRAEDAGEGVAGDAKIVKISAIHEDKINMGVVTQPQMMFATEENEALAMEAYWNKIKETALYDQLMNADEDTFYTLLEEAKKEPLPEIDTFREAWKEQEQLNLEVRYECNQKYIEDLEAILPTVEKQQRAVNQMNKILNNLHDKKVSDQLIGGMKVMHEFLSLNEEIEVKKEDMEKYQAYLEAMERVVILIDSLYEKDEDGFYEELNEVSLKNLQQAYKDAYLIVNEIQPLLKEYGIRGDRLCEVLENDIVALAVIDKNNLTTLPEIMKESRTMALDVSGSKLPDMENQKNIQIPVKYTNVDGQEVEGFFIKETDIGDVKYRFQNILKELKKNYPGMKEIVDHMAKEGKKDVAYMKKLKWDTHLSGDMEGMSVEEKREAVLASVKEQYQDLQEFDAIIEENKEEAIEFFIKLIDKVNTELVKHEVFVDKLKFGEKEGIDIITKRNVTMSEVAEILQIPDIVVKAKNITAINENKDIEGIFMEKGKGIDIAHLPADDPMRGYGEEVYNNARGIKSLADLQVLDYICMNVDRHPGNMLYQFDTTDPDHPQFIGVQGIDNDASFGLITEDDQISPDTHVTKLQDLGVISESLYKAIIEMDPLSFKAALKHMNHSEAEVDAACKRLQQLKDKIAEDAKYFAGKEDDVLEHGRIRVVSDEAFQKLTFDKILDASPNAKIFKNVKEQVMKGVPFTEREDIKQEYKKAENIQEITGTVRIEQPVFDMSEINVESKHYYKKLQRDLTKMLLETKRVDSVFKGSSKEFKTVQKHLKESVDLLSKMKNPKKEDIERLNTALSTVLDDIEKYNEHKKKKSSGSEYEKNRIATMNSIQGRLSHKYYALEEATDKYIEKLGDAAFREEKEAQREQDMVDVDIFRRQMITWRQNLPQDKLQRRLAAHIVERTLLDAALKYAYHGVGKKVFPMDEKQFNKEVMKLRNDEKFRAYCKGLNKEQLTHALDNLVDLDKYIDGFKNSISKENQQVAPKEPEINNPNIEAPEAGGINPAQ